MDKGDQETAKQNLPAVQHSIKCLLQIFSQILYNLLINTLYINNMYFDKSHAVIQFSYYTRDHLELVPLWQEGGYKSIT